jgi:hypothetical protein
VRSRFAELESRQPPHVDARSPSGRLLAHYQARPSRVCGKFKVRKEAAAALL